LLFYGINIAVYWCAKRQGTLMTWFTRKKQGDENCMQKHLKKESQDAKGALECAFIYTGNVEAGGDYVSFQGVHEVYTRERASIVIAAPPEGFILALMANPVVGVKKFANKKVNAYLLFARSVSCQSLGRWSDDVTPVVPFDGLLGYNRDIEDFFSHITTCVKLSHTGDEKVYRHLRRIGYLKKSKHYKVKRVRNWATPSSKNVA
jgi:hypothetical protein